jgi:NAD(P)-dependent dehydrogenase (short-subunit alcohol dehydrogenase family)
MTATNGSRSNEAARLAGKIAIVSGAARGVGRCISDLFSRAGASVVMIDIRDELGEAAAGEIQQSGGKVVYQHVDVRNREEWKAAVERCEAEFGFPNVLVNNAFKYTHPAILEITPEQWQESLDINLTGAFNGIQAVLPGMVERGSGTLVTVSSSNGNEMSLSTQVGYQAAKAGLTTLTRHVAVAHGKDGIRANSIHPGPIRGAMLEEEGFLEGATFIASGFPIARLAEPEEIAYAAIYLASDESSYVTGTALVIDGGSVTTINFPGQK